MRSLVFEKEICRTSIEDLLVKLREMNAPQCVHVDSPGGRFEFFSSLAPAIERRGLVTTAGNVRSAAVILFLLGHTRYATPNSSFFFHEVRTLVGPDEITICSLEEVLERQEEVSGEGKEFFQEWLRRMQLAQAWFLDFMAQKTQLRPSVFQNLMRSEATLSAKEALRYGIVHKIVSEELLRN